MKKARVKTWEGQTVRNGLRFMMWNSTEWVAWRYGLSVTIERQMQRKTLLRPLAKFIDRVWVHMLGLQWNREHLAVTLPPVDSAEKV